MFAARYVYLLALSLWLGGTIVLGAIVAPSTFDIAISRQPDTGRALAGAVFGESMRRFQFATYGAAAVMLGALLLMALLGPRPTGFRTRIVIVLVMLISSLYAGFVVSPRIRRLQAEAGGQIVSSGRDDPRGGVQFRRSHRLATILMLIGGAGGLALLFYEAKE